jgi:hypothetical protein
MRLKNALWARAAVADWCDHLLWVMLGILAVFHEDRDFCPAESMFGSQLVLPGQFVDTAESRSSSFLVQTAMAGRSQLPMLHNCSSAMTSLPKLLLLARFVLVHIDCAQLPVIPLYDRPFSVFERSTHFFLLKIGDGTNKVSMLPLKLAWTLADTEQEQPPAQRTSPSPAAAAKVQLAEAVAW